MASKFNYKDARNKERKFIRYKDGKEMYGMGITKFQEIAKEAGAVYKIKHMVLVNTEVLDRYLEQFHCEIDEEGEDIEQ